MKSSRWKFAVNIPCPGLDILGWNADFVISKQKLILIYN